MLSQRTKGLFTFVLSLVATAACTATEDGVEGPAVAIEIAPLSLPGVTNARWNLTVRNAAQDLVMSRDIEADAFGDGAGSVSYVAPCDATSNDNTVSITLLALYSAQGEIAPTTYVNPGPLTRSVTCRPNADTPVVFNVTIARDANQGFFDVAVNFDDIFCSAKLDCTDAQNQPLQLLHNSDGTRDDTVVLALACTGGASGADTQIYLNNIVVTCPGVGEARVNPAGGPGTLGPADIIPGGILTGAAVYRGEQDVGFDMRYWNVSLGFKARFADCVLSTRATAADGPLANSATPAGWTYPYIDWNVTLTDESGDLTCTQHPISGTPPGLSVGYTAPNVPQTFTHGFNGTCVYNRDCPPAPPDCTVGPDTDNDGVVNACDPCPSDPNTVLFNWVQWPELASNWSGTTITGNVGNTTVTYTSNRFFSLTTAWSHSVFAPLPGYGIPNRSVIKNTLVSSNTLTFGRNVSNPLLVFSSIGASGLTVTVGFDDPVKLLWCQNLGELSGPTGWTPITCNGQLVTEIHGREGNVIVQVPGVHANYSFDYLTAENSVQFMLGFGGSNEDIDLDGVPDICDTDLPLTP